MGSIYGWWGQGLYNVAWTGGLDTAIIWDNRFFMQTAKLMVNDVYNMDVKMDDGIAASGRFVTVNDNWDTGNCVTGSLWVTDGSAVYNMSDTATDCTPVFWMK